MDSLAADLAWLPGAPANFRALCREPNLDGAAISRLANHALNSADAGLLGKAIARRLDVEGTLAPLIPYTLAILSNATTEFVVDALPAAAARYGVAARLVAPPYDQVLQQVLDRESMLYRTKPDAVLLALDHRWFGFETFDARDGAATQVPAAVARLREAIDALRRIGGIPAIVQTIPAPPLSLFGSYDRRMAGTARALAEEANRRIAALAEKSGCYLLDAATLAERIGTERWFDPVVWHSFKLPFAASCVPAYADGVGRLIGAIRGKSRKCLVLDLDNTIWGGVVGDDGMEGLALGAGTATGEAFLAVQRLALDLRARGVMLAVSSRNDEQTARAPFREHPDMLLREEHISVFQANWLDKAANIEAIAKALNIGVDALVLLDDNPAERAFVRAALPGVAVPELPADPSWYARYLSAAGYFEAISFTAEDRMRADAYVADARRAEVMTRARDVGDYLQSLDMTMTVASFDARSRQRIAQLINKSNQFNLTTQRYTEAEIAAFQEDPAIYTLQARLRDRFGDLGMISVVICRPSQQGGEPVWSIDSWVMSCRVLGRQVEMAMLSEIVTAARRHGVLWLFGRYHPTPKNGMVADHYTKLGFSQAEIEPDGTTHYRLSVADFVPTSLPMTVVAAVESVENVTP